MFVLELLHVFMCLFQREETLARKAKEAEEREQQRAEESKRRKSVQLDFKHFP